MNSFYKENNFLIINKDRFRKFIFSKHIDSNKILLCWLSAFSRFIISMNYTIVNEQLKGYFVKKENLNILKRVIYTNSHILFFTWSNSFEVVGYNFDFRKLLAKCIIRLDLGFSDQDILLELPKGTKLLGRKRWFRLFSNNLSDFYLIYFILLNIRNIFPYKKRGLVPRSFPKIWLKPGKKVKYR